MSKHVLITGGAGFIGSHLARELLRQGYTVRALDNLSPQVHGPEQTRPSYLERGRRADGRRRARRRARSQKALKGVDAVYHFAALVGVGQSMYEIARYTDVNNSGTATLLEALIEKPVERLVVASSMSIYGEGLYRAPDGTLVPGTERGLAQLQRGDWEVRDEDGERSDADPDARIQDALAGLRVCAVQVRPGADVPDRRAGRTTSRPSPCASSTCSARTRRFPTPIRASSPSSPRATSTAVRR